jgi:hypothetical protein
MADAPPKSPHRWRRTRRWLGRLGWAAWGVAQALAIAFGYGMSAGDAELMRRFRAHVYAWEDRCDFREVCYTYTELGSAATHAKFVGMSSGDWVMVARSMPGLPEHLRVNEGSREHYNDFIAGPLSAYLHLSDIQGVQYWFDKINDHGGRLSTLTHAEVLDTFNLFQMHRPPTRNEAALESWRTMLVDIEAWKPFTIREAPGPRIRAAVPGLALKLGVPTDIRAMCFSDQARVFAALDAHIREYDPELWRTKQVSDFLSGVWGQSFGFEYMLLIEPALALKAWGQTLTPLLAVAGAAAWLAGARRPRGERAGEGPVAVIQQNSAPTA